jgi:hypothetical protein
VGGGWLLVAGGWFLVVGSWLLVLGCWFLVVGSWLLVLGCWFLVVGGSFRECSEMGFAPFGNFRFTGLSRLHLHDFGEAVAAKAWFADGCTWVVEGGL